MKVRFELQGSKLVVQFECQHGEPKREQPKMAGDSFYVQLDSPETYPSIHPDHLALIALLVVRPWLGSSIVFDRGISRSMAAAFAENNITAQPVDEHLTPYSATGGGFHGLAYSGGADSTAALSVMPPTTVPVFLDRPKTEKSLYAKEAALLSCEKLRKIGYHSLVIDCNLEQMREPIGFPTDLANGVPAIAMAVKLNLCGISYGTVFESLYGIGRIRFKEYESTSHKKMWWSLFESAGLPISFPVGGVSEVGTELICSKSPFNSLARSCIRGTLASPCNNCWKCFRKSTLKQALSLQDFNIKEHHHLLNSREVKRKLSALPISHENVLLYSFSKLDMSNYPGEFETRFSYLSDVDFLERWYAPSLSYVHNTLKDHVGSQLQSYLQTMDEEDHQSVENWDIGQQIDTLDALVYEVNDADP